MASIRERHNSRGTTWAVLYRDKDSGRQTSRTFTTKQSAQDHLSRIERMGGAAADRVLEALAGHDPEVAPTLTATVLDHIDRLHGVQPDTKADYRAKAHGLADAGIGDIPIDTLTREDIGRWTAKLATDGQAEKTIRNKHALVSAALTRATDDGLIPRNPAARIRIARQIRKEMVVLTPPEFAVLLDRATPHYRPFLMWQFGTGMRLGEATAIQVGDLRLTDKPATVTVVRAWKKGGALGPPKTRAGRRTLSLPSPVVEAIKPLLEGKAPGDLLFTNMAKRRIIQGSLHDLWQGWIDDQEWGRVEGQRARVARKPALGKVPRIHDLRHSHAAWMIGQGISLFELKQRLGHESIQTTADTYGHLLPEAQVQAERAAALAFGTQPAIGATRKS